MTTNKPKTYEALSENEKRRLAIKACKLDQSYRIHWTLYKDVKLNCYTSFHWCLQRFSFGKWLSTGEYGGRERFGFIYFKSGIYPIGRDW